VRSDARNYELQKAKLAQREQREYEAVVNRIHEDNRLHEIKMNKKREDDNREKNSKKKQGLRKKKSKKKSKKRGQKKSRERETKKNKKRETKKRRKNRKPTRISCVDSKPPMHAFLSHGLTWV